MPTNPGRPPVARHRCLNSPTPQCDTWTDGLPRRRGCRGCHSRYIVQYGWHGVFIWRGDGRYPLDDAIGVYVRRGAAERLADATPGAVVRWVCAR